MLLLYWILQEGTDVEAVLWACGPNWDIMKEGSGEGAREGGKKGRDGGRILHIFRVSAKTSQLSLTTQPRFVVVYLCLTLCNFMDCSPPALGTSQARKLEWAAISSLG